MPGPLLGGQLPPTRKNSSHYTAKLKAIIMRVTVRPENVRKILAAMGVMSVTLGGSLINLMNSSFLVPHFSNRNVSSVIAGLVGSGIGIGYLISPFINILGRLHHHRGVKLHNLMICIILSFIFKAAVCAATDHITHNPLFSAISLIIRIFGGIVSHTSMVTAVECIRSWFPYQFQILTSLTCGTSGYIGYAIGSTVGSILYENFGYYAPYLFGLAYLTFSLILCLLALPRTRDPLGGHQILVPKLSSSDSSIELSTGYDSISPLVMLPLVGQFCINVATGYLNIAIVPFLVECCNVSISRGGSYITILNLTVALGFGMAGWISQKRLISTLSLSAVGGLVVTVAILLMFPDPDLAVLYEKVHYIGYLAIVLAGLGDPMVLSVSIMNMESVQTELCQRTLQDEQKSKLVSIWSVIWMVGLYGGMFFAGILMDTLPFAVGAWIISSICGFGVAIFVGLRIFMYIKSIKKKEHRYLTTITIQNALI